MNNKIDKTLVCPWWFLFTFDNPIRRLIHDPIKTVSPYVHPGDTVLDVGCGMGTFTIAIAKLVGETGKVIAADVQPEMLAGLSKRAKSAGMESRIQLHLCQGDHIGISEKVDWVNAFWMVHEVPNRKAFLQEIYQYLKPNGKLFIAEPYIHVPRKDFDQTVGLCQDIGFVVVDQPKIKASMAVLVSKPSS